MKHMLQISGNSKFLSMNIEVIGDRETINVNRQISVQLLTDNEHYLYIRRDNFKKTLMSFLKQLEKCREKMN